MVEVIGGTPLLKLDLSFLQRHLPHFSEGSLFLLEVIRQSGQG